MSHVRSRLFISIFPLVALTAMRASPALPPDPILSDRIASYSIAVRLDTARKMLDGTGELRWCNISSASVRELQFHLYLNAFRSDSSTFMREHSVLYGESPLDDVTRGWIDLNRLRVNGGPDLLSGMRFLRPEDGNPHDSTLCAIRLARPIPPGDTAVVQFAFTARLPAIRARTGSYGDFYMVGQWFPKIAVLETSTAHGKGRPAWSGRQFHALTEFYADFGTYDVALTVPAGFVVGATGTEQSSRFNGDGTRTVMYRAYDVHDFAWTASPRFLDIRDRWRHVHLRLLLQPHHQRHASRQLEAAKATLEYMDRHVGFYPYTTLTIVDPPFHAEEAGGMEYPTLVTTATYGWLPASVRFAESVTVHEIIHQYWQGMVANDETRDAWLDEGLTTYYEDRVMDHTYGPETSVVGLPGLHWGSRAWIRSRYTGMRNPSIAAITTPAWDFARGGYYTITYSKTATVLATLERLAGTGTMDSAMQTYFQRWRFRHPSGGDFRRVLLDVLPRLRPELSREMLRSFLDQMLDGRGICDYEVTSIVSEATNGGGSAGASRADSSIVYSSRIRLGRRGDIHLPVDILVRCEDGSAVRRRWDGNARTTDIILSTASPVRDVVIDPEGKILVDIDTLNNSSSVDPPVVPLWKAAMRLLVLLQAVAG